MSEQFRNTFSFGLGAGWTPPCVHAYADWPSLPLRGSAEILGSLGAFLWRKVCLSRQMTPHSALNKLMFYTRAQKHNTAQHSTTDIAISTLHRPKRRTGCATLWPGTVLWTRGRDETSSFAGFAAFSNPVCMSGELSGARSPVQHNTPLFAYAPTMLGKSYEALSAKVASR